VRRVSEYYVGVISMKLQCEHCCFCDQWERCISSRCVAHIGFALGWPVWLDCMPLTTLMWSVLRSDLWLAVIEAVDACVRKEDAKTTNRPLAASLLRQRLEGHGQGQG
jgi:hypothetical protein